MSDYTKTTNFTAKDSTQATILGSEHDAEFNAIASSVGTKMNKIGSPTADRLLAMNASGEAVDSGFSKVQLPIYGTPEALGTATYKSAAISGVADHVEIAVTNLKVAGAYTLQCVLGSGSAEITGYYTGAEADGVHRYSNTGTGFYLSTSDGAGVSLSGTIFLDRVAGYAWIMSAIMYDSGSGRAYHCSGSKTVGGNLSIVQLQVEAAAANLVTGGYWRVNYRRSS
jgi:hypothetical protein